MKRFISLALVLLTIAMSIAACGSETAEPSADITTTQPETTEAVTEFDHYANLPAADYEGYEFTVMTYEYTTTGNWALYIDQETSTGEILNDAAIQRNQEVEDKYNIDVKLYEDANYMATFQKAVMAGENIADLIAFWATPNLVSHISSNVVYDWKDIPVIDLDARWWNQTANNAYSIAGKQYFAVSDFTFTVHQHFRCLFNKNLMDNLNLDYPYQSVYDGTWTYDKLMNYIKDVYTDINGDGKAGAEDRYGMVTNPAFSSMFVNNFGEFPVKNTSDGFELNLFSDKIASIVTDIVSFNTNPDVYMATGNSHYDIFNAGNSIFSYYGSDPAKLRDIEEFDFGYLPYPKYDENQSDYIVWSSGGLMAVPITTPDTTRTGTIVEALSAASNKYISDAFVETYISFKVLRDEDSQKIYRMMRDLATYDFSYNIDPSNKITDYQYYSYFITKKTDDAASRFASVGESIKLAYDDLYKAAVDAQ